MVFGAGVHLYDLKTLAKGFMGKYGVFFPQLRVFCPYSRFEHGAVWVLSAVKRKNIGVGVFVPQRFVANKFGCNLTKSDAVAPKTQGINGMRLFRNAANIR